MNKPQRGIHITQPFEVIETTIVNGWGQTGWERERTKTLIPNNILGEVGIDASS